MYCKVYYVMARLMGSQLLTSGKRVNPTLALSGTTCGRGGGAGSGAPTHAKCQGSVN